MSLDLEQKLEESERRYKLLADNVADVVWMVDADSLRYLYISPSIQEMRGYTPEEFRQFTIKDSITAASLERFRQRVRVEREKLSHGLEPRFRMEVELNCKDGSTVWAEIAGRFYQQKGQPLMIIGITRDISERRAWEHEREELIRKLQESLAKQKKLAAENRVLRGLLPICAECKRIRNEKGEWQNFEQFIEERAEVEFTHTICPACTKALYPELTETAKKAK